MWQAIETPARMPELRADYFDFPPIAQSGIKDAVLRDFESLAEWAREEKKQQMAAAGTEEKERSGKGAGETDVAGARVAPWGTVV